MKNEKVKLSGIKKMLSRDEMKKIIGGGCMSGRCANTSQSQCYWWNGCNWVNGYCTTDV